MALGLVHRGADRNRRVTQLFGENRIMSITVECPKCGRAYAVSSQFAGRTARCKACQSKMTVPMTRTSSSSSKAHSVGGEAGSAVATRSARATAKPATSSSSRSRSPANAPADPMDLLSVAAAMERSAEIVDEPAVPETPAKKPKAAKVDAEAAPAPSRQHGTVYRAPAQTLPYGRAASTSIGGFSLGPAVDTYLPPALIAVGLLVPMVMNLVKGLQNDMLGGTLIGLAIQTVFFFAVFVPLGLLGLKVGGKIMSFEAPHDAYKRMAAVICVPASCAMIGLLIGGPLAALLAALLGLLLTYPVLVLLMQIGFVQGLVAWIFMGIFFVVGTLGAALVLGIVMTGIGAAIGAAQ